MRISELSTSDVGTNSYLWSTDCGDHKVKFNLLIQEWSSNEIPTETGIDEVAIYNW